MNIARTRPFGQKYAFVVVGVIFLTLLAAAGLRATPGVLMVPLEQAFGWSRGVISSPPRSASSSTASGPSPRP